MSGRRRGGGGSRISLDLAVEGLGAGPVAVRAVVVVGGGRERAQVLRAIDAASEVVLGDVERNQEGVVTVFAGDGGRV